MPSENDTLNARPHRLHPTSLIFNIGSILRQFLIPALIVLFVGRGGRSEFWLVIFALPVGVYSLIKYITLRYRFSESELIVKEGVFHRNERHIPYHHIQNIDTRRNLLHRLLGVADVQVQTASGTKPEAELRVLSTEAVEIMRQHVFEYKRQNPAANNNEGLQYKLNSSDISGIKNEYTGEPVFELDKEYVLDFPHGKKAPASHIVGQNSISDLVKLGVISNRGMLFIAAASGILWQFYVNACRG